MLANSSNALNQYCVAGTMLSSQNILVNMTGQMSVLMEF